MATKRKKERGAILIYVLGMTVLLSLLVTQFLIEASEQIKYRAQLMDREDLKLVAFSAFHVSLAVLNEIEKKDGGLFSPLQGWGNPLELTKVSFPEGYNVTVSIVDETGKMSIYEKDQSIREALLDNLSVNFEDRQRINAQITNWLETEPKELFPKDLTQKTNQTQKKQNKPSNTQFRRKVYSLYELKNLERLENLFFDAMGKQTTLFERFQKVVTVHHEAKVNVNTASHSIRNIFFEEKESNEQNINSLPSQWYKSLEQVGLDESVSIKKSEGFSFNAQVLKLSIEVKAGGVNYFTQIMINWNKSTQQNDSKTGQYKILDLIEDYTILN